MKVVFCFGFAACVALVGTGLAQQHDSTLALDPGGLALDVSSYVPKARAMGEDLLKNGGFEELAGTKPKNWTDSLMLFTHDKEISVPMEAELGPLSKREVRGDAPFGGKGCMVLSAGVPRATLSKHGVNTPNFTNYIQQYCPLPAMSGDTRYVLKFRYRGKVDSAVPGSQRVLVSFFASANEPSRSATTREFYQKFFIPKPQWQEGSLDFVVPKETRCLGIQLFLDGCGEAAYDDVGLYAAPTDAGVVVRLAPASFLDNRFCLSSGDPGVLKFLFRNEVRAKIDNPRFTLELPGAIPLADVREGISILEKKPAAGGAFQYVLDLAGIKTAIPTDFGNTWQALYCLIHTNLPPGDTLYRGRYWYSDGAYQSAPREFGLQVLPAIRGNTPASFQTGVQFRLDCAFQDADALDRLATFYKNAGFNRVHMAYPGKFAAAVGKKGLYRYGEFNWLVNGYQIGQGEKPPHARFQFADGSRSPTAICPVEVYREGDYYKKHVVAPLRKLIVVDRQVESVMCNWEPYDFKFAGCFCDRCRDEFARFTNAPAESVARIWPRQVVRLKKDAWLKFRAWQHAELVVTLEKTVSRLGQEVGVESHFVPEIAVGSLTPYGEIDENFRHYTPRQYADRLPVLEPWGPYVYLDLLNEPSSKNPPCSHLNSFLVAATVRKYVDDTIADPARRPRLIAFPHGVQGDLMLTEPEAIEFEMLNFFLQRWGGGIVYFFPGGYDARYWAALARANSTIARFEPFVSKGTPSTDFSIAPVSPSAGEAERLIQDVSTIFEAPANGADKALLRNRSIVQGLAFESDGKRLIAVGNFWEKGECFFRLAIPGLKEGNRYVLREPVRRRCFAGDSGEAALSAKDLAKGLLLHVGALRYAFFLLEPYQDNEDNGDVVRSQDMAAARNP